jgi:hypothetical protein
MQNKLHRDFVVTLSGLFLLLAVLAGIGLVNGKKAAAQFAGSLEEEREIRRLLTEITIQRLELNSSFDRYLQACLNKIKASKPEDFDHNNVNQFLLYDLELQRRFHQDIRSTISGSFKPGKLLELVNEQILNSEQEVEYFKKNLLLEKGLFNATHAKNLQTLLHEIRQKKLLLQQKLRALLTDAKFTEISHESINKSSQNTLLMSIITLLIGVSFGVLFSYVNFKRTYFGFQTPIQVPARVIKIIEARPVMEIKKNGITT